MNLSANETLGGCHFDGLVLAGIRSHLDRLALELKESR